MINKKLSTIRRVLNPDKQKFNILTCPTHEGYQTMLDLTAHTFLMISGPNIKKWDYQTRDLPPNHFYELSPVNESRGISDIDLVLCQNRSQQYGILKQIADEMNVPMVVIDHTMPPPGANEKQIEQLTQLRGDSHVYITEHSREAWGDDNGVVIRHGIDTDTFKPLEIGRSPTGVSIVNQFPHRDVFCGWSLWSEISSASGISVDLYGDNPGLSESISDPTKLSSKLNEYSYFLNTSQWSPVPLSMLEAMACGLPVVSTAKQEIPSIIKHGINGYLSNDKDELVAYCKTLQENPEKAYEMGQEARNTILSYFAIDRFVDEWNDVFLQTYRNRI